VPDASRRSALINPGIRDAMWNTDPTKAYNQDDATGFIRLNALRLKSRRVQRKQVTGD